MKTKPTKSTLTAVKAPKKKKVRDCYEIVAHYGQGNVHYLSNVYKFTMPLAELKLALKKRFRNIERAVVVLRDYSTAILTYRTKPVAPKAA